MLFLIRIAACGLLLLGTNAGFPERFRASSPRPLSSAARPVSSQAPPRSRYPISTPPETSSKGTAATAAPMDNPILGPNDIVFFCKYQEKTEIKDGTSSKSKSSDGSNASSASKLRSLEV